MAVNTSEANLEAIIERVLVTGREGKVGLAEEAGQYRTYGSPGGYHKRKSSDYDATLCLDSEMLVNFVRSTQPKTWAQFKKHNQNAAAALARGVSDSIKKKGALYALRNGFKSSGCAFKLVYFRPNTTFNPESQRLYEGNLFSVIRQVYYRPKRKLALDMAIFVNGMPLFTVELKNRFTNQDVFDAIKQYKEDRDPKDALLKQGRCLAHFAVDPELVYFTTTLAKQKTRFFPFNRGYNMGKGNPPAHELSRRFATSYLWEEVWSRDSILNLIQKFVQFYALTDAKGNKTKDKMLLFPRYHQLMAVRRLINHAQTFGAGQRYLVQHSAGSGKTFTIAWLAHQLVTLYDDENKRIFDSVIVITDRRVLDRQLQQAMRDFEQKRGVVANIGEGKTSKDLKAALETGAQIIVSTLQKFPVISKQVGDLPGTRFAVIVDEAHSSQSGASKAELNRALYQKEEGVELPHDQEVEPETMEDVLVQEMELRRHQPNISTFAFTATPKSKTLQLFGTKHGDGSYRPFSLYPMRQAIEEGFIEDVLKNYTTYDSYFHLLKTVADDPHYDKRKATRLLKAFVDSHERTIKDKVAVIVEHFATQVQHRLSGKAKAMIVTRSREHAVRYKLAIDEYIHDQGYEFHTLVAFSGKIELAGMESMTETNMNSKAAGEHISDSQTASTFNKPGFGLLIVANKFQTGFDQPLLHTMYVDKKLWGVNAVQTLSRLNRTHAEKQETIVIDFVNEAEEIKKSFEPYYENTLLTEGTDPNALYGLYNELADFHFYSDEEVSHFAEVYFKGKNEDLPKLYAILKPVQVQFDLADEEEQADFREKLRGFVRLYGFLAQVLPFSETDWEKLFHFGRLLLTLIPKPREELPEEVKKQVDMDTFQLQQMFEGSISLQRGEELSPVGTNVSGGVPESELEALSRILAELNKLGGVEPTEDNKAAVGQLRVKLSDDTSLRNALNVNTGENARLAFDQIAEELFEEMIEDNFKFYKTVTDNGALKERFFDWLYEQYEHGTNR